MCTIPPPSPLARPPTPLQGDLSSGRLWPLRTETQYPIQNPQKNFVSGTRFPVYWFPTVTASVPSGRHLTQAHALFLQVTDNFSISPEM